MEGKSVGEKEGTTDGRADTVGLGVLVVGYAEIVGNMDGDPVGQADGSNVVGDSVTMEGALLG